MRAPAPLSSAPQAKRERLRNFILPRMRCIECPSGDLELGDGRVVCKGCGKSYQVRDNVPIMLANPKSAFEYTQANVTENHYSGAIGGKLKERSRPAMLDLGAGNNLDSIDGLIKIDIFAFPHVDIVGAAEHLPFKNGVFDLVVSSAVFEHVYNPFAASNSVWRVIKPGGEVYVETAFLQPVHAFPNHFFNMTVSGATYLFSNFKKLETGVQPYQYPSFTLCWILDVWSDKLAEQDREAFLKTTVGEIVKEYRADPGSQRWMTGFQPRDLQELACGVFFHGRKDDSGAAAHFSNAEGLAVPQVKVSRLGKLVGRLGKLKQRTKEFVKRVLTRLGLLQFVKRLFSRPP